MNLAVYTLKLDTQIFNTLNAEFIPICRLLALLGSHHILHVSGIRVKKYILFGGRGDTVVRVLCYKMEDR